MRRFAVVVAFLVEVAACGSDRVGAPTAATVSPIAPSRQVTALTITGNTVLTAVGETAQLKATATFSDRTVNDVTAEASWTSSDSSVVSISASGLLMVLRFGAVVISARYETSYTTVLVRPTPAGTFVISGWVREPGQGGLGGVTVTDPATQTTGLSNASGNYSLITLPRGDAHLVFRKQEYEPAELDATQVRADAALQRIIRIRAGEAISPPRLAPNDLEYTVDGTRCFPCRLVRLAADAAGTWQLRVTWSEPRVTLSLWANGSLITGSSNELIAELPIPAGETIVYVGVKPPLNGPYHVEFNIEASRR